MGDSIIKRQGIKQSIVTYLGVILGSINLFIIYTYTLSQEELGFIQYMRNTVTLVLPFVLLGTSPLIIRYFPYFKNKGNGHNGFLSFMLAIPIFCFAFLVLFYFLFHDLYFEYYPQENDYLEEYSIYLLPWIFLVALSSILSRYISNFKRIVVPAIFNDLFIKIGTPILCVLFYLNVIGYIEIIQGIVVIYLIALLGIIIYVWRLGELYLKPNFGFLNKGLIKEIMTYNTFGIIGGIGNAIVLQLDIYMVGTMLGFVSVAIYTIPLFTSNVIDIPKRAISGITSPIIAEAWKKNDLDKIEELYKKTSINQFILGLLLLIGIWVSVDDLYQLIPEGKNKESYEAGKYIILILGTSKVVDMVTGINSEIISNSKYYRFNFYVIIFLAAFTIITNLIFIPIFGINGAALATMASFVLFNLTKVVFLKWKLNMQPFSINTLKVFLIGAFTYMIGANLPDSSNPFINIIYTSITVLFIYLSATLFFKVSEEINQSAKSMLKKIRNY